MTIREQIWADLLKINDREVLLQIMDFIYSKKQTTIRSKGNRDDILTHVGTLPDKDTEEIKISICNEFCKIEGDW